eukprot:RCo047081
MRRWVKLLVRGFSDLPVVPIAERINTAAEASQLLSYNRAWGQKYGPIFLAPFAGYDEVHVTNFEGIDAVHRASGPVPLHGMPALCWSEYFIRSPRFKDKKVDFIINLDGPEWSRHRKPMAKKLLTPEDSAELADRYVKAVVNDLPGFIENNVDQQRMMAVDRFAFPMAFEIIVACLYGIRMGLLEQRGQARHPFIDKTVQMFHLSMPCMMDRSWENGNPPTPELQAWLDAMEELYEEGLKQMAAVESTADPASIFAYLRDNTNFTKDELNVDMLALMIGGVDTTSNSIGWLLHWMATMPEVQARVHAELTQVLKGATAGSEHFSQLKFLRYCMEESWRLTPTVFSTYRALPRDAEILGYHLPKGTFLIPNMAAASMNPALFPEPERFNPSRWEALEADKRTRLEAHTCASNFSRGPRVCPGNRLARAEVAVALSRLLQDYELSVAPGYVPPQAFTSVVAVPAPSPNLKWTRRSS